MGKASLEAHSIPVDTDKAELINAPARIGGNDYAITCVSVGNPHCVVFCDGIDSLDIVEMIMDLESELGVELEIEDQKIATFQELADFIESKLN